MKIVQINATCGTGSTGTICVAISHLLTRNRIENYILYSAGGSGHPLGIACSGPCYLKLQALKARVLGNWGFNSRAATRRMIAALEAIQPDLVHLHNLHGHDCDLEVLFRYFREKGIRLCWTFHDCWAFTGYCPHFAMADCSRWKTGCGSCPQSGSMSWFLDRSHTLWARKRRLFAGLDLSIIAPSQWMASLVRESFLQDYPVTVIRNGIDLQCFRPTESSFRRKHGLENKHLVLGVAFGWSVRKGLDVFLELAEQLDAQYRIVLVGTDDAVDRLLPDSILSIHRIQDQRELAQIYTAADVFVNPTREETFGLVNVEALACGTPVIAFRAGGSPETIGEQCGFVVDPQDRQALQDRIIQVCTGKVFSRDACVAWAARFSARDCYEEYLAHYRNRHAEDFPHESEKDRQ